MLYKFVGAPDEERYSSIFDSIFHNGTLKFSAPITFNDPFEFKYISEFPASRKQFDLWHQMHFPGPLPQEKLDHGWENSQGQRTREWIFTHEKRLDILHTSHILSLTEVCDNQLLWAHYAANHTGFCVIIDPSIVTAYAKIEGFVSGQSVTYRNKVPVVRWFYDSMETRYEAILFSKSPDWSYEREFRVAFGGDQHLSERFISVDPTYMKGIILGARASRSLGNKGFAIKEQRPDFQVLRATSTPNSFNISFEDFHPDKGNLLQGIL